MKKTKRILLGVLLVVWMGVIFCFSSQTGDSSRQSSSRIVNVVVHVIKQDIDKCPPSEQQHITEVITIIIRKLAHLTEYAVLAIILYGFLYTFDRILYVSKYKVVLLVIILSMLYAVTDEFHQIFIPGRGPGFVDVLIDTLGAALGTIFVRVIDDLRI
ncbi:MAG: VanZ family protein [Eubacterium sp.]